MYVVKREILGKAESPTPRYLYTMVVYPDKIGSIENI